jgi:predicted nucleic acid-binding protein
MLDTNIFNRVLDGKFALSALSGSSFVATKVQLEELNHTSDQVRRTMLLQKFKEIGPDIVPASFSFDIAGAGFGEGTWSKDDDAQKLHAALEALRSRFNNWHDALIAEAAFVHGCGLVTADEDLAAVAKTHGLTVYHVTT